MTPVSAPQDALGAGRYVSLTTHRRDGTPVATPVWLAVDGDALVVWTGSRTGKVKRARRDPAVTVAPCDMRGRVRGAAVPGRVEVLDADGTQRIRELVGRRYGLPGRLLVWWSLRRRGPAGSVGLRITF